MAITYTRSQSFQEKYKEDKAKEEEDKKKKGQETLEQIRKANPYYYEQITGEKDNLYTPQGEKISSAELSARKDIARQSNLQNIQDLENRRAYESSLKPVNISPKREFSSVFERARVAKTAKAIVDYKFIRPNTLLVDRTEQKPIQPQSNLITGYSLRAEQLVKREKNLEESKDFLFQKLKIKESPSDKFPISDIKAVGRLPFEIAALPSSLGGRVAFAGESLFVPEGRQELIESLFKVPKATISSFNLGTGSGRINTAVTLLGIKGYASTPPAFISKSFKGYTPYENAGFKVTPSTTEPFSFGEIVGRAGKKVTGVHTSFGDFFSKSFKEKITKPSIPKTEITVQAFPEQAGALRQSIGQYSFFKSLPEKATGKPQAYTGYIGIEGKSPLSSPSKLKFSFGEPKRYVYLFEKENIQPISLFEKQALKLGGKPAAREIIKFQNLPEQSGKSFLAGENLAKLSIEGQYVSPVGSKIKLVEKSGFTLYREPSTFKSPLLNKLQETTGIGLKTYRLDIVKAKTLPAESNINIEVPKPNFTYDFAKNPSIYTKSVSINVKPIISVPKMISTSKISNSFNSKILSISKPSKSKNSFSKSIGSISSKPSLAKYTSFSSGGSKPSIPKYPSPSKPSGSKPSIPTYPSFSSISSKISIPKYPSFGSPSKPSKSKIKDVIKPVPYKSFKIKLKNKKLFGKLKIKTSEVRRYTPTLEANVLNIKGKALLKKSYTGFEFRPIAV